MPLIDPPPVLATTDKVEPFVNPVFISDLHLTPARPRTIERFMRFMREDVPRYRELVILGDLFEFWIGDDAIASAAPVVAALNAASRAGIRVLVMHGNRDPLIGHDFASAAGATLLSDPVTIDIAGTATLLTHGDAWCTLDLAYQQFRKMARLPAAQRDFLSKPLEVRTAMARGARGESEITKATQAADIMDVTPEVVSADLRKAGVLRVIHGHTHRPATHQVDLDGATAERWVLPDWDLDEAEPRGGYLDFHEGQPRLVFFSEQ